MLPIEPRTVCLDYLALLCRAGVQQSVDIRPPLERIMLQAETDAEVEVAFKDLLGELPEPEVRRWLNSAKDQVKEELSPRG
jgi:hypothetical protein